MTKVNKTLLIICLVLVFSISITISFVSLHNSVNAESLSNNSVLNFNQLVNYDNINGREIYGLSASSSSNGIFVTGTKTSTSTSYWPITISNIVPNHKYVVLNPSSDSISTFIDVNDSGYKTYSNQIFTVNSIITSVYFSVIVPNGTAVKSYFHLNIIDLTQCFGAGNEPTSVAQFKTYFNSDYYAYTTSTLISLSTLDAYLNGVNDTLSNLSYSFTAVDSYNRITNANVKINNKSYDSTLNKTTLGSDFVSLGVPGSTQNGVLYFPFSTTLNAGDTISLSGYYGYAVFGSGSYSVDIVVVNGDSYSIIDTSTKTGSTINDLKYINNLSFTLPYSCSGIYFICEGAGIYVSNFTISLQVFNFQTLINDAYQAGKDSVDTATIESEAYQKGKQDGIALKGDNVWSNANEFIKNIFVGIFDILSIEFLPNVSLGTFVVIPLIFSVLFFIVKVSKGGGD